tara:strand:+ start:857 stop:1267 length:411 start_codon:yes stop_codon:yes gene_type:complete
MDISFPTSLFNRINMSNNEHHIHITPLKTYLVIYFTLLLMTLITLISVQFDFGSFNIVIAMIIASFKATLVLLFFMHLLYDNKINLAFLVASVVFLAVFIVITAVDTNYRNTLYDIRAKVVEEQAPAENFRNKKSY